MWSVCIICVAVIIIIIIIIIIIQYLCSALKSCKGYRVAGGFRLRLSEQVCFEVFFKAVYSMTRSNVSWEDFNRHRVLCGSLAQPRCFFICFDKKHFALTMLELCFGRASFGFSMFPTNFQHCLHLWMLWCCQCGRFWLLSVMKRWLLRAGMTLGRCVKDGWDRVSGWNHSPSLLWHCWLVTGSTSDLFWWFLQVLVRRHGHTLE